jgi:hypothetical protein
MGVRIFSLRNELCQAPMIDDGFGFVRDSKVLSLSVQENHQSGAPMNDAGSPVDHYCRM